MDKKLIGTAAVIGVVAGYMYSKDVFNSATFAASDSKCVKGKYKTIPTKSSQIYKTQYNWVKITHNASKTYYVVTKMKHYPKVKAGTYAKDVKEMTSDEEAAGLFRHNRQDTGPNPGSWQGDKKTQIGLAMEQAMKWADKNPKTGQHYIWDETGEYCRLHYTKEKPVTEKPSNQDEEEATVVPDTSGDEEGTAVTSSGSTDWCAIKAKYPARLKEIKGEIAEERIKIKADYVAAVNKVKDLNRKTSEKFEKEGAAELKRIKDRYAESKKNCSAKEEVQKKLKDTDIGEGFWEKLLAYLNA